MPELIKNRASPGARLAALSTQSGYADAFDKIQKGLLPGVGLENLQRPWPPGLKEHHFWSYYLEALVPGDLKPQTVLNKLVPFYLNFQDFTVLQPAWLPGRIALQAFIYPHCVALIINSEINQHGKGVNLTLDEAFTLAFKVRRTERYLISRSGLPVSTPVSLDVLANQGLTALREFALGSPAPPHEASNRPPFTVATVVQASGVKPDAPPGPLVICFLDALTRWPSYDWDNPPPGNYPQLNIQDKYKVKAGYPGDFMAITPNGRAVWYPKHWDIKKNRAVLLSCYHRNLALLSMQIESLAGLVTQAANEMNSGTNPLPGSYYDSCVKRAAIDLSLLYGGGKNTKNTYRSWSAKQQIEQGGYLATINFVRDILCNELPIQPI